MRKARREVRNVYNCTCKVNRVPSVTSKRRCDWKGGFSPFYTEVNATIHRSECDRVTFLQKSMRLD